MSSLHFNHLSSLMLLWLVPLLFFIFLYNNYRTNKIYSVLGKKQVNIILFYINSVILFLALFLVIFSISGPSWKKDETTVKKVGRDVVFLVDVSNSMLADDLKPNRLIQAKSAIKDTIELLNGDRAALVAFSGSTVVKAPLSTDYYFLQQAVDDLSVDLVEKGGTMMGDALRKTMKYVFPENEEDSSYRDIILITDGEDQGSYPVEAAKMVGDSGVRLIAIGLGNDKIGNRIPIKDENGDSRFLVHNGKEVWSKLDSKTLRKMASATPGGKYLNISKGSFDLALIYSSLIKGASKRAYDSSTSVKYIDEYRKFLLPGLILLFVYFFIRRRFL